MSRSINNNRRGIALLLKGAAGLSILLGLAIMVWLVDKALRYPEVHASQFGYEAPLWIPMLLFVGVFTLTASYIFVRAARRIEAGDDAFAGNDRRPSHGR